MPKYSKLDTAVCQY